MMGKYYKRFADAIDVPVEEVEEYFGNTRLTHDSTHACVDLISRQDAIEAIRKCEIKEVGAMAESLLIEKAEAMTEIMMLPSADRPTVDCTDFITWLRDEVLNEELWNLNAVGYGEIIARKLTKLGAMECEDRYYYSADRPKGEWVESGDDGNAWRCSQCNEIACCNDNYCPNCGADMRGGDAMRNDMKRAAESMQQSPSDGADMRTTDNDYERAVDDMQYNERYESSYNTEDGSL